MRLVKYDLRNNRTQRWVKEGIVPGEQLFITRPHFQSEDVGIIVTVVYDSHINKSFLLVLDAKSMKGIAREYTPASLPIGLHSKFIERISLEKIESPRLDP